MALIVDSEKRQLAQTIIQGFRDQFINVDGQMDHETGELLRLDVEVELGLDRKPKRTRLVHIRGEYLNGINSDVVEQLETDPDGLQELFADHALGIVAELVSLVDQAPRERSFVIS